jgi:hypothetical protein
MRERRVRRNVGWISVAAAAAWLGAAPAGADPESGSKVLAEPTLVKANGKPIEVQIGHAAPLVTDFDGDGVPDLLVGQFGHGELLVFRNGGTAAAPTFGEPTLFEADGKTAKVPSG